MAPNTMNQIRTHRFALSISGGVALGSYEAGVLSQMYRDLYAFNRHPRMAGKAKVTIDAIAGASAGSITGLILAQALSLGRSPDDLEARMRACWVELLNIEALLKPSATDPKQSLFTNGVVADIVAAGVELSPKPPDQEQEPVALWMAMTNLDGVPFVIDFKRKDEPHAQAATELYALDYKDYISFLLNGNEITMIDKRMIVPADGAGAGSVWQVAANAARASSAFPVAFPSQYQSRDLAQYPAYMEFKKQVESSELQDKAHNPQLEPKAPLPTKAAFQFTDGGIFNNQPIGKCINAVEDLNRRFPERDPNSEKSKGKAGRSFIIIEPEPQLPEMVEAALVSSTEHPDQPMFPASVVGKIVQAYFNTALYGDFKNASDMNQQLLDLDAAFSQLDTLGLDAAGISKLADIKTAIRKAVGLDGKAQITLQRVPAEVPASRRLASSFWGHFGGFLRRDFREADFITGQYEARQWLVQWLALWLQSHADDIGMGKSAITAPFVTGLLGAPPADPADTPIDPTGLKPEDLADAGWFPNKDATGEVTVTTRMAALSPQERQQIIQLAEARGEALLDAWFHTTPLGHFGVHLAMGALENLFNGVFIDDPKQG